VSLISRYVFREVLVTFTIVLAVLFVILMSNQFAELLAEAAGDKLPRGAVFAIFGLTSMRYMALIAPVALFLGVMLALARLNRDSERAALAACGVGVGPLLAPVGTLALVLGALVAWLALVQTPEAMRQIERIRVEARTTLGLGVLEPGKFTVADSGGTVIYGREVVGDEIRDVFLQREREDRIVVILAESAQRVFDPRSSEQALLFRNGRRYEGVPGARDFLIVEFAEHGIPVSEDAERESVEPPLMKSTGALMASRDPADRAELQWRVSAPLSLLVLALLAVPLSRSSPRDGRYARVGVGLLIYVVYANALSVARVWVEREQIPHWVGMWWVHLALGALAFVLISREAGWFVRGPRTAREAYAT
jgi:lipopolysaccharide export system permease protein